MSIVTVVYNGAQFLEETMLSVLGQDYPNLHYYIIDGGSTDGTMDIVTKYRQQLAEVISEPDQGMYDAINKGIALSEGDLWLSLNADDRLASGEVVSIVVRASQLPGNELYGSFFGNIIKERNGHRRLIRFGPVDFTGLLSSGHCTFMPQPATFVRRHVLEKVGAFDLTYRYASDYDYHLRLLLAAPTCHVNRVFTVFRQHEEALTSTGAEQMNAERLAIIARYNSSVNNFTKLVSKWTGWGKYLVRNRLFPAQPSPD